MNFEQAFQQVVLTEGGYSNDPVDKGGETKYGITKAVALAHGYKGEMKDLPLEKAKEVYRQSYWLTTPAESMPEVAYRIFDIAVNCGVSRANTWLLNAINLLNRDETLYPNCTMQNIMVGYNALNSKDRLLVEQIMRVMQGSHYILLCTNNETQEKFIRVWIIRDLK